MTALNSFTRKSDGPGNTISAAHINELQAAIEPLQATTAVSATYTILSTDDTIIGDASSSPFTATLPTAVGIAGKRYTIKRISASNNVTLAGDGSETIDGAASKALATQYAFLTVQSDGTSWHIIASGGTIS